MRNRNGDSTTSTDQILKTVNEREKLKMHKVIILKLIYVVRVWNSIGLSWRNWLGAWGSFLDAGHVWHIDVGLVTWVCIYVKINLWAVHSRPVLFIVSMYTSKKKVKIVTFWKICNFNPWTVEEGIPLQKKWWLHHLFKGWALSWNVVVMVDPQISSRNNYWVSGYRAHQTMSLRFQGCLAMPGVASRAPHWRSYWEWVLGMETLWGIFPCTKFIEEHVWDDTTLVGVKEGLGQGRSQTVMQIKPKP